jgi:hypothetical protein
MKPLSKRLEQLEAVTAPPPEPLEVTVRRTIVVPGPDGPVQVGEAVTHWRDGKRISTADTLADLATPPE